MEETYTYDAMVQYLYRDMPAEEALELKQLLTEDEALLVAFQQMAFSRAQLPKAMFDPAPSTIANILQYSAQTALELQS
jgi:hypothetical protein